MKKLIKMILFASVAVTLSSAKNNERCDRYLDNATKYMEKANNSDSKSIRKIRISAAINYLIDAKYECHPGHKDRINKEISELKKFKSSL